MRQWDSGLERRLRVLPPPAELCAANRHPPNRRGRITAPKCRQPDRAESAESQVRRKQSRHDFGSQIERNVLEDWKLRIFANGRNLRESFCVACESRCNG